MKQNAFAQALKLMQQIHDKKSHDYANHRDRFSNFRIAAMCAGVSVDTVFAVMDGIKTARLIELVVNGKKPKNESIFDTILDKATYAALRLAYRLKNESKIQRTRKIKKGLRK